MLRGRKDTGKILGGKERLQERYRRDRYRRYREERQIQGIQTYRRERDTGEIQEKYRGERKAYRERRKDTGRGCLENGKKKVLRAERKRRRNRRV